MIQLVNKLLHFDEVVLVKSNRIEQYYKALKEADKHCYGYSLQKASRVVNSLSSGNQLTLYILPKFNPYVNQNKSCSGFVVCFE